MVQKLDEKNLKLKFLTTDVPKEISAGSTRDCSHSYKRSQFLFNPDLCWPKISGNHLDKIMAFLLENKKKTFEKSIKKTV